MTAIVARSKVEQDDDDNNNSNNILPIQLIIWLLLLVVFQLIIAHIPYIIQEKETKRRWQHALTGHAIVQTIQYFHLQLYWCIIALSIGILFIWYIRYYQWDIYIKAVGSILRSHELDYDNIHQLPGAYYFLIGTVITLLLFPLPIALYSIECLSIADPIAAYIGQTIPSRKLIIFHITNKHNTNNTKRCTENYNNKDNNPSLLHHHYLQSSATISGSIACFITSWIIGYHMLVDDEGTATAGTIYMYKRITAGAFACTCSEAFPIILKNDNISIPLFTALIVSVI